MTKKLSDVLSISAEVVCSTGFHQVAIECITEWEEANRPDSPYLRKLREWRDSKRLGNPAYANHLPVMWGSGWAVDIPHYLNFLIEGGYTKEQVYQEVDALRSYHSDDPRDRWPYAFRISEWARAGMNHEEIEEKLKLYRIEIERRNDKSPKLL